MKSFGFFVACPPPNFFFCLLTARQKIATPNPSVLSRFSIHFTCF